ncbi:ATP-dependent zinc protease family protein [Methylotetracoccus oryzae]|uniref:ATP-dependent zinc protease family protein n=1 Tax=Methylotetracoccus oryzae TaxID=1919059 RepID=UPI002E2643D0
MIRSCVAPRRRAASGAVLLMLWGLAASGTAAAKPTAEPVRDRDQPRERAVMGWLESVFFRPWNVRMTAKLDTGANTSSLHAERIERFSRNGEKWVRFALGRGDDHKKLAVERPVIRMANIKQHGKGSSQREVVKMTLCKNGREYETEFTLVDRSNFTYPVLLGRSFLKDNALVDAGSTFLFKADTDPCRRPDAE